MSDCTIISVRSLDPIYRMMMNDDLFAISNFSGLETDDHARWTWSNRCRQLATAKLCN